MKERKDPCDCDRGWVFSGGDWDYWVWGWEVMSVIPGGTLMGVGHLRREYSNQ
jgi:hypothetical protein